MPFLTSEDSREQKLGLSLLSRAEVALSKGHWSPQTSSPLPTVSSLECRAPQAAALGEVGSPLQLRGYSFSGDSFDEIFNVGCLALILLVVLSP